MKKTLSIFALVMGLVFSATAQYSNEFIKLGQKAPELEFPNPEGKVLKLSEMNKGHYVLLDFWASWCGPCRMANPGLVKLYNEYSNKKMKGGKKFTVVSVSLDQNKDNWKAAMQKDGLIWANHMSDLKGWQSQAAQLYGLQFIPQAFLLDPKGNIVGKYQHADEAQGDLAKFAE